jgi:response regulator RpfG family c-di-GMP phosphodiesterase
VVDTFDAIMTDRPYRPSADAHKALEELIRFKGRQFDPAVVDAFVEGYHEGSINCCAIYGESRLKDEAKPVQTAPV